MRDLDDNLCSQPNHVNKITNQRSKKSEETNNSIGNTAEPIKNRIYEKSPTFYQIRHKKQKHM